MTYLLLNSNILLRRCLHGGPIPLSETAPGSILTVEGESQVDVPGGTVTLFLQNVADTYGAYGYAALDGHKVIGQVRFYPSVLASKTAFKSDDVFFNTCILDPYQVKTMASINRTSLPEKAGLSPKSLSILCFQLVNDYKAMAEGRPEAQPSYLHQGIGTKLLEKTIEWARSEGWEEIHATAIPHIPPLMTWSCHLSIKRFEKLGFEITPSAQTWDGPISQRKGHHGTAMQQMWKPYTHLSDEEVSRLYNAVLKL